MTDGRPVTLHTSRWWPLTIGLLVAAVAAYAVSQMVWQPHGGNRLGVGLLFLSTVLLVVAAVHPCRRPRSFAKLALWSLVGIPVFAILHNVFYAIGEFAKNVPVVPMVFEFLHAAAFVAALMLCPAAVVIGVVGWIVTWWLGRRDTHGKANHNPDPPSSS